MTSLIFVLISLSIALLSACGPCNKNPDNVYVGEAVTATVDWDLGYKVDITYNSCTYKVVKEKEEILIIENLTLKPNIPYKFSEADFVLKVFSDDTGYNHSVEENLKINGYDIFKEEISEEINYSFCFKIPYKKGDVVYTDTIANLKVLNIYSLLYYFES